MLIVCTGNPAIDEKDIRPRERKRRGKNVGREASGYNAPRGETREHKHRAPAMKYDERVPRVSDLR